MRKKVYVDYKEGQGFRVVEVAEINSSIVTKIWGVRDTEESAKNLAEKMNNA